jgi:hypothetical protein
MSDIQLAIVAVLALRLLAYMFWNVTLTKLDLVCICLVAARLVLTVCA